MSRNSQLAAFGLILSGAVSVQSAAAAPDLAGQWGRDMLFFEQPASTPGPVMLAKRGADGRIVPKLPCCAIVQTWFGDPNNPILKPDAADMVKRFAELS